MSSAQDLGNTFGALFIGVTLAAILFGLTNVQAFIYLQTHSGTRMTVYKLAVIGLWILDALHLALITHCVYYYLIINYANTSALLEIVWSFKLQFIIDFLIIFGVHVLYACRIWIINQGRSKALPVTVVTILILGSGVATVIIWEMYQCHVFTDLIGIEWSIYTTLGAITFVDFVMASSLCYLLVTSRTGFSSTDSLLTKLVAYVINTGCLTSVFSMIALITCAVMPGNLISISIGFLIATLYVNSYIALLNARYYLQPKDSGAIDTLELRTRPALRSRVSEAGNLQEPRKIVFKHPYDHDDQLHHTHPSQAVMPMDDLKSSFSSA
ncbi:hypothetical protein M405DRAFT_791740 [Rhizopogon salebrosus TDB-379]|nr:hypothetical protein M405DRAFT_791740 [Rhizopogon salebrosus TDB-379]